MPFSPFLHKTNPKKIDHKGGGSTLTVSLTVKCPAIGAPELRAGAPIAAAPIT